MQSIITTRTGPRETRAHGVYAAAGGSVALGDGSVTVTTVGGGSRGILATGAGSIVTANGDVMIVTTGSTDAYDSSRGISAEAGGKVSVLGTLSVTTSSSSADGAIADGANSIVELNDVTALIQQSNSSGLRAAGGGSLTANEIDLKIIRNTGNMSYSYGLLAEGSGANITIGNGSIYQSDNDGLPYFQTTSNSGLRSIRSGLVTALNNLIIETNGFGARGIYVSGRSTATSDIAVVNLNHTSILTNGSLAAGVQIGKTGTNLGIGDGAGILNSNGTLSVETTDESSPGVYITETGSQLNGAGANSSGFIKAASYGIIYDRGNDMRVSLRYTDIETTHSSRELVFVGAGTNTGSLQLFGSRATAGNNWLVNVSDQSVSEDTYTPSGSGGRASFKLEAYEGTALIGSVTTAETSTFDISLDTGSFWELQGIGGDLSQTSKFTHLNLANGAYLDATAGAGALANFVLQGNVTAESAGEIRLFDTEAGDRLTIDGSYTGNGGRVGFDTVLFDDTSTTDMLVVTGNTSGTTNVVVANAGGTGAQTVEGIKIIEVGGASEGKFSLLGDYTHEGEQAVVGGAYAYKLYQGGVSTPTDGDWYLRSQLTSVEVVEPTDPVDPVDPGTPPTAPLYQAGVPTYETYAQSLLGLNGVSTLQQRVGNRFWAGNGNRVIAQGADPVGTPYAAPEEAGVAIEGNGVWGRIEGAHNSIEPHFSTSSTDYDQNILKLQAGLDGLLVENEGGKLIGGVTVHYAHGKTKTNSVHGDGEISTDGYGFGGTLTWYGENGFYLDGQAQLTWYRSDLNSTLANTTLVDGNDGFGYALSVEGGKRIAIDQAWSLTPQAQLVYSSVDFDDFTDTFGSQVSLDRGDSLQGRLGLTLDHESSWQNANGQLDRAHVYGIANLYYEFLEGTKVDVAGTSFASEQDRLWGGLGIGGSYNWNDDKYSIYGEGLVNTSLNNFGDSYSVKGQAGFRVKW
ncbi:autotransporter outer membrane beta-barrel domain-containing protein [Brucellaceae bacterium D45D]